MDLTGDDEFDSKLVGHMNRPYTQLPVRTPPNTKSVDERNSSSGFTPINSKRKHDDGQNHGWATRPGIFGPRLSSQNPASNAELNSADDADSEDRDFTITRMTNNYNAKIHEQSKGFKKEQSPSLFDGPDDIYSSDREPSDLFTTPNQKRLCRRYGSPFSKTLQADPFISQDMKMEDQESESAAIFKTPTPHLSRAASLVADQDYFATSHEADSESDDDVMNTTNSTPKTPSPRFKTPKQRPAHQRFSEMFSAIPKSKPKPYTSAVSNPQTPISNPKSATKFLNMFGAPKTPRSPEAKKFNEACDAFEVTHKSPPNTPVTRHKFQPVAIKEEEPSMRVQPPFGIKSEIEADGFVDVGVIRSLPFAHPGGAEMQMSYHGDDYTGYVP
jgi:hypothetical protein